MAKFFGSHLERKPVDRTVLRWLTQLPDTFYVFVELQGGDFQVDFLVLKQDGIFNVEAKNWNVRRAHLDSDWELTDGRQLHNPVLQAREQCDRVGHYLLLQRDRFLSRELADIFLDKKSEFKVFPVVAISHPKPPASVPMHPYFKIFVRADQVKKHLEKFSWEVDTPAEHRHMKLDKQAMLALAELWKLQRIDPATLAPSDTPASQAPAPELQRASVKAASATASASAVTVTDSPYQYTYTVTGEAFYGRSRELEIIRRALVADPARPVAIQGLQRTGKSSRARESIARHVGPANVLRAPADQAHQSRAALRDHHARPARGVRRHADHRSRRRLAALRRRGQAADPVPDRPASVLAPVSLSSDLRAVGARSRSQGRPRVRGRDVRPHHQGSRLPSSVLPAVPGCREGRVRLRAAPPPRRDRQGGRRARPDVGSHRALAGQEGPPRRPQTPRRQPDRHRRKRPPGTRRALPRRSAATVDEAEPDHDLGAALRRHQWRVMLRHLSRHETSRQKNQVPEGASAEQGSVIPPN